MRDKRDFLPRTFLAMLLVLGVVSSAIAQWAPLNPVVAVQPQADGVIFTMKSGVLRLKVCTDSIVHVLYSPASSFPPNRPDPVVIKTSWPATKFAMQANDDEVTLTTSQLRVVVTRKDGAITYRDLGGNQLVQEATRKLTPVKVNGEDTYRAESFVNIYGSHEAFYGLGQQQADVWNKRSRSPIARASFPGMLTSRTFRVVFVGENHGVGIAPSGPADRVVQYFGKQITVSP